MSIRSNPEFTQEDLKSRIHYDPLSGAMEWVTSYKCQRAGKAVGWKDHHGYVLVQVFQRRCYLHRLAWLYVYGVWPQGIIDHINRDTTDNRIANLREASAALNSQNRRRTSRANLSSKYMGVTLHKKASKWQAVIRADGACTYLGLFTTEEAAHEAYQAAKRVLHPEAMA